MDPPPRVTTPDPATDQKIHEIMVSEEEAWRTFERNGHYAIAPLLPELMGKGSGCPALNREYSPADSLLTQEETRQLLEKHNLMLEQSAGDEGELLR